MSLLIAVVAVTNLALGFFLAIYLDMAHARWASSITGRSYGTYAVDDSHDQAGDAEESVDSHAEPPIESNSADSEIAPVEPSEVKADTAEQTDDHEPAEHSVPGVDTTASDLDDEVPTPPEPDRDEAAPRSEVALDEEATLAGAEALRSELAKLKQDEEADADVAAVR